MLKIGRAGLYNELLCFHNTIDQFGLLIVGLVCSQGLPTRLVFGSFYNINTTWLLLMSTEDMSYWVSKFLEDCSLQIDNMVTKSCREHCEELGYKCGIGPVLVLHAVPVPITCAATWSTCFHISHLFVKYNYYIAHLARSLQSSIS